jgi:hypothetical protein
MSNVSKALHFSSSAEVLVPVLRPLIVTASHPSLSALASPSSSSEKDHDEYFG